MTTEIAKVGGALAVRPDQTEWTPQQGAVLRQSGIDNQVTSEELSAFLHLCQRTRLDPFSRQIYLIGRYDKRVQRKVYTPQTSIDGYRVIAHRAAAEASHPLGYEDTLWCDGSGKWRDVWLSDAPPAAAKVTVIRNGMRFSVVARYTEYVQTNRDGGPSGLWGKMPATMTAKCAEALALRMAFPHDLAGVYTAEEMGQADNPAPADAPAKERHLRRVQPGEADQWATPAIPAQKTAAEGREYLREALDAPDADAVRRIYREAAADGAVPEYLAQIAEVGKKKAAEQAPATEEPLDTEDAPDEPVDEHTAAVNDLRAAAEAARLDNFEDGAEQALGIPIADASANAIRTLAAQIRNAA